MKSYILLLTICSILVTCVDPVDFKTDTPINSLVIEGQLTTGEQGNYVYLSKVSEYGKTYRIPVEGATVQVMNEAGNPLSFIETSPGIYVLADPTAFKGVTGKRYHLEVKLSDGTAYRTDPEVMPAPVFMDSISMELSKLSNGQIDISVNTTFPDYSSWLKYKVVENYAFEEIRCALDIPPKTCYFQSPALYPFAIATNDNNNATKLDHFPVGRKSRLTTTEFSRGRHYFSVHQYAITQKSYIYFDKLNKLLTLNGSVFDAPPAALKGNLYKEDDPTDKALGYFELASVDTMRTFTYTALVRAYIYLPDHCDQLGYYTFIIPRECCDCLSLPGASLVKPEWWE